MTKVLLVEDDNNLREIFEMRLQAEGFETSVASDGEEALVVALKEKPDLIIADVMMPKMSGFEMVETLRAAPDMANVKVIMMTALGQAEDRARGEKLGVVKYLVKSQVTLEDFVRTVKEALKAGGGDAGQKTSTDGQSQVVTNDKKGQGMQDDNNMPNQGSSDAPAGGAPSGGDAGGGAQPGGMPSEPAGGTNPVSGAPADEPKKDEDENQGMSGGAQPGSM